MSPKKIKFESREDVVDFVSRGFIPPSKKNFNEVMTKVKNPDTNESKRGKEVIILENIIAENEREILSDVLQRIHDNRIRNRNIALAGVGTIIVAGVVVLLLGGGGSSGCNITNSETTIEPDDDEINDVEIIHF